MTKTYRTDNRSYGAKMTVESKHQGAQAELDVTPQGHRPGHPWSNEVMSIRAIDKDCEPAPDAVTLRADPPVTDVAELAKCHLSLVGILVSERLRNLPTHVLRDDLMSAGMMALVLSARAYEPHRGVPFRSFAAVRIRGALIDELRAMDWASRSVRSRAREAEIVRDHLTNTLDRVPASDDIAGAMGISTRELDALDADSARGSVLSLQLMATDTGVGRVECPESLLLQRERIGYLHDAIAALPERLRFVVVAHFFGRRPMKDIATDLSVTQPRVSQMCNEAIALIRHGMNSQLDPDALRPMAHTGRAAATRNAYCRALAARNTVAGRLAMSNSQGEIHAGAYTEQVEISRIA